MLEKDQEQVTSETKNENEEPSIDQETRQSRLSRSAAKRGRTAKPADEEGSAIQRIARGVGGAFKRYGSYGFAMLKSPSRAIHQADTLRMKYAWISIVLFSVFFALGNYVQLKASKTRLLGFGIHYSFGDAFLKVAVFTLILLTLMMLTVWVLGKYMLKGNISLKEVIMKFGAVLVPVLVLSILWLVFAMLNIPYVTVILSVMMFFGLQLIAIVLFRSIQSEQDAVRGDLMYAGWVFLLIELVIIALLWGIVGEYLIPSLVPVRFG
ncbi:MULTISPECIES: hypothetical protein [Bacillus]|uniref:hypothetical protein n=1 Tax=Bacillus TaxID=1386 RepID=UPI0006FED75E|nr:MULTISPECIES: hypothetical protein [Bacillus]KQU08988.1 hypothetical protein ASG46_14740 [Bacillus sp. Leaf49]MCY7531006.1 hypothetical protein [Bacillus altitudinis]MCY7622005.1 hypothetical protein [Bacillus altitudinis]MED0852361.1 hypothetical protein [Bacillus altitudinis]WEZ69865.1 hypothetical protein P5623_11580 [Bacillus altitudinis]